MRVVLYARVSSKMNRILAICLPVVMLCFLMQQSMAGSRVFITSEPSGASVTLDGAPIGQTPLPEMSLAPGEYQLEFQLDGYQPRTYSLKITDDGLDRPVHVRLTPLPRTGSLRIESEPADAIVYVDDTCQIEHTPLTIQDITVGTHNIRVEKAGFRPITRSISVEAGKTNSIHVPLSLLAGIFTVRTQPSGAEVMLDRERIGKTPIINRQVPAGKYHLRLSRPNYQTIEENITIADGKLTTIERTLTAQLAKPPPAPPPVKTVTSKQEPARIIIRTEPAGADVFLNEKRIGKTELTKELSPGSHAVRLVLSGYQEEKFQLTLKAGDNQTIDRKLTGIATLIVRSQPAKAVVYIDNTLVGPTPQTKKVVAGSHVIRIVSPGHKDWIETRSLAPGEELPINAHLIALGGGGPMRPWGDGPNPIFLLFGVVGVGIVILAAALVILLRRRTGEQPRTALTYTRNITPHQAAGATFGEYQLLGEIGRGGMAVVYQAQRRQRPGLVALKIPFENMLQEEEFVRRFLRQAEIGAQLSHPCIVNIIDSGEVNGTPYLAMEYVQGGDLRKRMNQQGPLLIGQAVKYIVQVCEALDYVHLKQIYHRDIKPENILLTEEDGVKVVDFGIALAKQMPKISVDGVRWFSGGYLCPDREFGPTSDLYSLGAVFYEMLTSHLPFESGDLVELIHMHENEPPFPLRQWRADIPEGLEAVVIRMLAKMPTERYLQAVEVIQALRPYTEAISGGIQ